MDRLYHIFEIIGTIAFSISGSVTAIRRKMDLLGVIVLGMVTAVGGGVLRDVIGNMVPAIFDSPDMILITFVSSFGTFFVLHIRMELVETKLFFLTLTLSDSIGLAVFTILGCQKMLIPYASGTVVFFGVLTGVGGGLIRDILAGQTPYVLSKHFYACSCIIGAVTYILLRPYKDIPAALAGMTAIFVTRMLAVKFKWNLPKIQLEQ